MKRHAESALAFRQASASYQQNGMLQFQALSMQNAMAAEQAGGRYSARPYEAALSARKDVSIRYAWGHATPTDDVTE
jgi:hypothetical protein